MTASTRSTTDAAEQIVEAALALGPQIRAAVDEMEQGRRLPPALVEAMQQAGVFRMTMPHEWGGPEADPLTQMRVVEALSLADGSVGWCSMIGSDGGYFTAFLDQAVAREMYPDINAVTATVLRPSGRALAVTGGYRVSGRWKFASGCQHSTWIANACAVFDDDTPRLSKKGSPEIRVCFMPAPECEIIDTWTTTGLRGTGSHDVEVNDVFVPAERTFNLGKPVSQRQSPLYALPSLFLSNLPGVPLGITRSAIDTVVGLVGHKPMMFGNNMLCEEAHIQSAVAQAEAQLGSVRSYWVDVMGDLWETLRAGDTLSTGQRARYRLCMTYLTNSCVQAVTLMYQAGGGSSLYASHPLDRHFRDIHTLNQHVVVSQKTYQSAGRMLLGLEPGEPFF